MSKLIQNAVEKNNAPAMQQGGCLFTKATRYKAKARLALMGVTGSGKTLSALYLAYGLTGDWSKVALIDTEHERARFYANRSELGTGEFYYAPLTPPYSVERYKEYVAGAEALVGPDGCVIIDSLSHAWNNEGGVLDYKEKIVATTNKNSYTAWQDAGKVQNSLINSILSTDCHTIVTMRSKMDYILVENEKGKMEPRKVGLAPVQRDDTEYEFDIIFDIDRSHKAQITKDTSFISEYGEKITPKLGESLREWLDEGVEPPAPETCEICGVIIRPFKTASGTTPYKSRVDSNNDVCKTLAGMP